MHLSFLYPLCDYFYPFDPFLNLQYFVQLDFYSVYYIIVLISSWYMKNIWSLSSQLNQYILEPVSVIEVDCWPFLQYFFPCINWRNRSLLFWCCVYLKKNLVIQITLSNIDNELSQSDTTRLLWSINSFYLIILCDQVKLRPFQPSSFEISNKLWCSE